MSVSERFRAVVGSGARAITRAASRALGRRQRSKRTTTLPVPKVSHLSIVSKGLARRTTFAILGAAWTIAATARKIRKRTLALPRAQVAGRIGVTTTALLGWISNLDADAASLKGCSIKSQSLHQAITGTKLGIGEALRSLLFAVLDDTDADNVASCEEVGNAFLGGLVREVSEMQGEGRLVWNLLRKVIANSRVSSVTTTVAATTVTAATVACTTVAGAATARRKRLGAGSIGVLNLISPRATTKACIGADELVQGHLLTLFLFRSHDCGWVKSYAQRSGRRA
jgi:hypothetical protein